MLGGGAAAVAGTCAWALPLWLTSPRGPGSSQMRPRRTLFRVVRRLTVLPLPSTMEERSHETLCIHIYGAELVHPRRCSLPNQ